MRKLKQTIALVLISCMLASSISIPGMRAEARSAKKGWNIDIYMCGADLESQGMCGTNDIIEIMKAKNVPSNVQITIQTGGCKFWCYDLGMRLYYKESLGMTDETIDRIPITNISADYIQRFHVKYDNVIEQDGQKITYPSLELISANEGINNPEVAYAQEKESVSMGDADVLEEFVRETASEYENNALIFWNHGSGTEGGVCIDEYSSDSLSLVEIDEALTKTENVLTKGKFDVIGYDACLMSTFETLAVTSRHALYGAASMTLEPGPGWYYTPIIQALADAWNMGKNFTGKDFAKEVVDAYNYFYLSEENQLFHDDDANMVAYDLSKMPALIVRFDKMASAMSHLCANEEIRDGFLKAAYRAKEVDTMTDLVGMESFLNETIQYTKKYLSKHQKLENTTDFINYENCTDYIEAATIFQEKLFDGEFNYHSCLGAEASEYALEKGISFYFPQKDSADQCAYARGEYEKLGISNIYAGFAYNIAYHLTEKQSEKPGLSVVWDKNRKKYQCKLLNTHPDYLMEMVQGTYLKIGNKYYSTGIHVNEVSNAGTQYFAADKKYASFNGSPLQWNYYGTYDEGEYYLGLFEINGNIEEALLMKQGKKYYMVDYEFEPGDKIAAVVASKHGEIHKGKNYTITEKDVEEDLFAPKIEIKTAKDSEVMFSFQATTQARWYVEKEVKHGETVAFTEAKASLAKKEFKATGKEIRPQVIVKMGKKTLKKGKDYKLVYENNIAAGTAVVKVVGLGKYQYAPVKVLKFKIHVNYSRRMQAQAFAA